MYVNVKQKMGQLPSEYKNELLDSIHDEFMRSGKTIVVLDDDPTGTQTCYDIIVLTSWKVELITAELEKKPSILYILTNSRSLPEQEAVDLTIEVAGNLKQAVVNSGREIVVISRSDSTLRGHFPAEVNAIAEKLDLKEAVVVIVPAFIEGGRFTIDDIHYIIDNEQFVPVSDTPFAKDAAFGYTNADLKKWVEEKSKGRIKASEVNSVSIEDIRQGGPEAVSTKLKTCAAGTVCIVNAAGYRDLEVVVMGLLLAEKEGKKFLYRSSATIVPIRAGMESGRIYHSSKKEISSNGVLVIVGSHVPKSTSQLNWLLSTGRFKDIEIDVNAILHPTGSSSTTPGISKRIDALISSGNNVVVYTSRSLQTGNDAASSLQISARISAFLVDIVKQLSVRPRFIVAKGGITSSDLASKGLLAESGWVLGPVIPGVPLWQLDEKSKFPGIMYVVFPGNVGGENALEEVVERLM